MSIKNCSKCKKDKPIVDFHNNSISKDGHGCWCKSCSNSRYIEKRDAILQRGKERYQQNKEAKRQYDRDRRDKLKSLNISAFTEARRNRHYLQRYGIDVIEYEKMFSLQNGCCALCGQKEEKRRLDIDHCHSTGKVRKLLCSQCNKGLGNFKDNAELLTKAIEYLKINI